MEIKNMAEFKEAYARDYNGDVALLNWDAVLDEIETYIMNNGVAAEVGNYFNAELLGSNETKSGHAELFSFTITKVEANSDEPEEDGYSIVEIEH